MALELKWLRHEDLAIRRFPSVSRDEYLDWMTFGGGKPLFTEIFGPLVGLKEEWEQQGASPEELDFSAFPYRCEERSWLAINTGRMGGETPVVLQETAEAILSRDELGRTMKLIKGAATLPLPLDYPVQTMDDWLRLKPLYQFSEARFSPGWEEQALQASKNGAVVCTSIHGGFDEPRQLLGEERLCLAFYEQPELVRDILGTMTETAFRVLERVSARVRVDLLFVHEDMAGKSGPLAGPRQVREFIAPFYRKIWELLAARGTRLFDQDSDGDMNAVLPAFLEAGINAVHPCEPAANMDIVQLRSKYGTRLAFTGGIDKHVLRRSLPEIEAELEYKLPPLIQTGACVFALDHRIPNGTPLANYRYYIRKVWEILEREAGLTPPRR